MKPIRKLLATFGGKKKKTDLVCQKALCNVEVLGCKMRCGGKPGVVGKANSVIPRDLIPSL